MFNASTGEGTISVCDEDTINAAIADPFRCFIGMAIYQEIPNVKNVRVDERSIRFSIENWRYRYTTPKRAVTAINTFDAGKHPKPFQLQLTKANITDTTNVNKYMRDYIRQIPKNSGGNSPPKPVKKIVRQFGLCTKV